jgi:hypothetical protein
MQQFTSRLGGAAAMFGAVSLPSTSRCSLGNVRRSFQARGVSTSVTYVSYFPTQVVDTEHPHWHWRLPYDVSMAK